MLNVVFTRASAMFCIVACCLFGATPFTATAHASTAVFTEPTTLSSGEIASLSTADDGAGVTIALNEILALLFDTPFGVSKTDSVSIFTVAPSVGSARLTVSFGRYNGGVPIFVETKSVNAGNTLTVGNLFQQGCSAFGGCDYIEIITTRTQRGASGAEVDYVDVNGEVITVAAPTPEPATWAMMILGFSLVAYRLKTLRYAKPRAPNSFAFLRFPQCRWKTARWLFAAEEMRHIPKV